MKDVAKEAGVSLGTVSKVVNGLPVGNSYRFRVENAIKKLNYQVNSYAQGLKANKTHTIALLIPNTQEPFFASLVYHINIALLKRKYRMLLCSTDYDSGQEQEYVTMVQQNKVDGIIGLTYNPNLIIEGNTSFVSIDRSINPNVPCVTSDNFAGQQLSLGLKYEMKLLNDGESFEEFDKFLEEHIHEGKLSFDGIFCVTDSLAYYIIKALRRLQQRVPEDVQVIGFDGIRSLGNIDYICSTIVQPVPEIAEMCVELLLQEDTPVKPPLVCFPVTYAYGGSTCENLMIQ